MQCIINYHIIIMRVDSSKYHRLQYSTNSFFKGCYLLLAVCLAVFHSVRGYPSSASLLLRCFFPRGKPPLTAYRKKRFFSLFVLVSGSVSPLPLNLFVRLCDCLCAWLCAWLYVLSCGFFCADVLCLVSFLTDFSPILLPLSSGEVIHIKIFYKVVIII